MQSIRNHVLIAANPKSGAASGSAKVAALSERLSTAGLTVEVCHNLDLLRERSLALWQSEELRAVVSAGGDGTAAAVVNLVPLGVPMAILPLGTENLLAKFLDHSGKIEETAAAVVDGHVVRLDAGSAGGRLFLIMLGTGFDAEVVVRMHAIRRGHIRRWSYTKPIWQAIRSYNYPEISVEYWPEVAVDAAGRALPEQPQPQRLNTAWLFAFNLPRYAANLAFCPQADGTDGCLDLCAFTGGGLLRSLGYFFWLVLGRHQQLREFKHVRARRFRLTSSSPVPYQVDGDPGGMLPLEVEVLPERLTLLVPRKPGQP